MTVSSYRTIMLPKWQYEKMIQSYDEAMNEIRRLKEEISQLTGKKVAVNE